MIPAVVNIHGRHILRHVKVLAVAAILLHWIVNKQRASKSVSYTCSDKEIQLIHPDTDTDGQVVPNNSGNKWAELHKDIFKNILSKLCLTHSMELKRVCKSWRSCAMEVLHPASTEIPWLLLTRGKMEDNFVVFFSLSEYRNYMLEILNVDLPFEVSVVNDGWLMITKACGDIDAEQCFLLNPITSSQIQLPPLKRSYSKENIIVGPSLSFLSTLEYNVNAATANKLLVATISKDTLVFCRAGDSTWSSVNNPDGNFYIDVVFCKGQLYALDECSKVWVYEFTDGRDQSPLVLSVGLSVSPPQDEENFKVIAGLCLMESSGDLLLLSGQGQDSDENGGFRVYKLDRYLCQWVEVKNLQGDHTLFLGAGSKNSVPSKPDAYSSRRELRKNCIYHARIFGSPNKRFDPYFIEGSHDVSVFHMRSGTSEPCFPSGFHKFGPRLSWFTPNIWI